MKIICSSDEEEAPIVEVETHAVSVELEIPPVASEMPLPPTINYDSSDHSDNDISIRKPTKQDRVYAHQIAQKALRELQFELPQRKSKLNMSKFLSDHGITRDQSMEKLMKRIKRKKSKSQDNLQDSQITSANNTQSNDNALELIDHLNTNSNTTQESPQVMDSIEGTQKSLPESHANDIETAIDPKPAAASPSAQSITMGIEVGRQKLEDPAVTQIESSKEAEIINTDIDKKVIIEVLKERETLDLSHLTEFVSHNSSSDEELAIVIKSPSRPGSAKKARKTPFYIQDMEKRKIVDINKRLSRLAEKQGVERREKMLEMQNQQLEEAKKRKQERKIQRQKDQEEKLKKALEIIAQRKKDEEAQAEKTAQEKTSGEQDATTGEPKAANSVGTFGSQSAIPEESLERESMAFATTPQETQTQEDSIPGEIEQKDEDILDLLSGQFPETQANSQPLHVIDDWQESQDNLSGLLSGNFSQSQPTSKFRHEITEDVEADVNNYDINITDPTSKPVIMSKATSEFVEIVNEVAAEDENEDDEIDQKEKPIQQLSRNILDLISESEESESSDEEDGDDADEEDSAEDPVEDEDSVPLSNPNPLVANPLRAILSWNNPFNQPNSNESIAKTKAAKPGAKFVETEAEVEEDEFMNYGGLEGEEHEGQDQYDLSMLNDDSAEPINLEAVLELHKQQLQLDDEEQVQALINDVTSGALRKRKSGRDGTGKGLDMYDSDDETEALLRRIRAQLGVGQSKKDDEFDGTLQSLASNPQTQAFANCFFAPGLEKTGFLSSSDEEEKTIALSAKMARVRNRTGNARKIARSNSNSSKSKSSNTRLTTEFAECVNEEFPISPKAKLNGQHILSRIKTRKTTVGAFTRASTMVSVGSTQITSRLLSKKSIIETGEENLLQNENGKSFSKLVTGFRAPKPVAEPITSKSSSKVKKIPREKKATARRLANLIGGRKT